MRARISAASGGPAAASLGSKNGLDDLFDRASQGMQKTAEQLESVASRDIGLVDYEELYAAKRMAKLTHVGGGSSSSSETLGPISLRGSGPLKFLTLTGTPRGRRLLLTASPVRGSVALGA